MQGFGITLINAQKLLHSLRLNSFIKQDIIQSLDELLNLAVVVLEKQYIDQKSFN
jgi:hypothetical protein